MDAEIISRYRIVEKLGTRGITSVYRAYDQFLGREVAIRILPARLVSDPDVRERFLREVSAAASIAHPSIASVYDTGQSGSQLFIVTEYIRGESLASRLTQGLLPLEEVIRIGMQVGRALVAAHERHVIHRDLKPSNVLITTEGDVKVVDFGLRASTALSPLTALEREEPTFTGAVGGTPAYMSPEEVTGQIVDEHSDMYSFGALLFEMATGRQPVAGEIAGGTGESLVDASSDQMMWLVRPVLNRPIPEMLEAVIVKCLEKRPKDRFQSMKEVVFALSRIKLATSPPAVAACRIGPAALTTEYPVAGVPTLPFSLWLDRYILGASAKETRRRFAWVVLVLTGGMILGGLVLLGGTVLGFGMTFGASLLAYESYLLLEASDE